MWALIVVSLVSGVMHTDMIDYQMSLDDCKAGVAYVIANPRKGDVAVYCELDFRA